MRQLYRLHCGPALFVLYTGLGKNIGSEEFFLGFKEAYKGFLGFSVKVPDTTLLLLLLVWHAPLGVRSAKRRHQSPEWTILSHSYRLIQ